ncbi:MAG: E3 binding domain-containing protein, partial [Pseudolabrys sp.]
MPTNILMPALSPTMEKGNLAKWLTKEGDKVSAGDVIAEIETDKATMEYEAVDEGTLAKIVVPEGTQDVAVNSVIAVMAGEGEDVKATAASAGKAQAAATPAPQASAPAPSSQPSPMKGEGAAPAAQQAPSSSPLPSGERSPPKLAGEGAKASTGRIFSSPLARRLAKDAGIDLSRVTGSGPHGRVVARDIEAAKSGKGLAPAAGAAAPAVAPAMTDQQVLALFDEGSYELIPHDSMRRTIAQRLTAAAQSMPVFYLTVDCDLGKL